MRSIRATTAGALGIALCLSLALAACTPAGQPGTGGEPSGAAAGQPGASSATDPAAPITPATDTAAPVPARQAAFWRVLDSVQALPLAARVKALEVRLATMSTAELEQYLLGYVDAHRQLYTWRHWGAASAFFGFVSDDVFFDVRGWVMLHGSQKYGQFLKDPDSLGGFGVTGDGEEVSEGELLDYAPAAAFRKPGGAALQERDDLNVYASLDKPTGEPLPEDVPVRELFPKNAAAGEGKPWYLPDEIPEGLEGELPEDLASELPGEVLGESPEG